MRDLDFTLRQLLGDSANALFTDYSVASEVVEAASDDPHQLCGILGFTGDLLCGTVIISATEPAVADSNPVAGPLSKWLAELTNQIVGRFKNDLLRRGVDVSMSVPVVLSATRLVPIPQHPVLPLHLKVGSGSMTLWLEVEGDVVLQAPDESEMAREGEAMMF